MQSHAHGSLPSCTKVGILGGGQLARMMIAAGRPLGLTFSLFAPAPQPCVAAWAPLTDGRFDQPGKRDQWACDVDVITYEHENIPVDFLRPLEATSRLHPGANALVHAQDRLNEKQLFNAMGIPTNRYSPVDKQEDLKAVARQWGYPFLLKSRRGGYDGKHQHVIRDEKQMMQWHPGNVSGWLAEQWVDFDYEVSVIGVRGRDGALAFYDLCYNQHHAGILFCTKNIHSTPASANLIVSARDYVARLMQHLDYVGVLTLEYFVKEGAVLANEIAPRVHNSGHWTIEGAQTSQFENHLRAICGLPLGSTRSMGYSALFNCVGVLPDQAATLAIPGVHYHHYGKSPRPGRKLGHVTLVDPLKDLFDAGVAQLTHQIVQPSHA